MAPHELLEQELAEWIQFPHVVACSSGTAALYLACAVLAKPNTTVVVPDYTIISCARAVTLNGMIPRFADCDSNLLITDHTINQVCWFSGHQVSSVMPVHIYGRRCPMDPIIKQAQNMRIAVIEDMAEIHGVLPHPETTAACYSFYSNKIVHGEEGGCVAFRDKSLADEARKLRCLGFQHTGDYQCVPRGFNLRLADTLATLVSKSLKQYNQEVQSRRYIESEYQRCFPSEWLMPYRDSPWIYDFRIPGIHNDTMREVIQQLIRDGIPARRGFYPLSRQPEYINARDIPSTCQTNADLAYQEIGYLPLVVGEISPASIVNRLIELVRRYSPSEVVLN